jgi:pullulanase/glycogen debranching enzyme
MARAATGLLLVFLVLCLTACGGGGGGGGAAPAPNPGGGTQPDPRLDLGNSTAFQAVLHAVPTPGGSNPTAGELVVHYKRAAADYTGWQLHVWGVGKEVPWNSGYNPSSQDSFGAVYRVPLTATSGNVGYLFHKGDVKDHGGADQSYTVQATGNEIWRVEGDPSTYRSPPSGSVAPDLHTVRVHYKRFDGRYGDYGLHLWSSNGMDTSRIPAGVTLGDWNAAVPFASMPNYSMGAYEVVFDIPVLNPKDDATRKNLTFLIHGQPPKQDDKDGRNNDLVVDYASLAISGGVGQVWVVQDDPAVYTSVPDTRVASTTDARAYWLSSQWLKWPRVDGSGVFKLYHSQNGQILAPKDGSVTGADGSVTLDVSDAALPGAVASRFAFVPAGVVLKLRSADAAQLPTLLRRQLVLVQEDASGKVQNATTAQLPGVLDELYSAAESVPDLGVSIQSGNTRFKLWAPTAQQVLVFTYDSPSSAAKTVDEMSMDSATGIWSASRTGDLSGSYYRYAVDVFVPGVGVVRNWVTDPYSISLSANSARSYIANLSSPALKPAQWDATPRPNRVGNPTDMVIYELHVRDFSATDATVPAAQRGKYLAFTEAGSDGVKHLQALSQAGVTDVHLLPIFDIASVPEVGCTTPNPSGAPDGESQQATVMAQKDGDCFNWGYDPYHFNAPEGSYASDAQDGAKRILELRAMVQALHKMNLRVGMDVVYNHTTASGQKEKSILDRVVPGYYHRLNGLGQVEMSTCCDNTATENRMMGKLMIDSVKLWATQYGIDSFRFDIMGHQPRSVMEKLQTEVNAAVGRPVQLLGEGWNFGEVANGARFVQASQLSLNGTGIGTFSDRTRDAVRGGGGFDSGDWLVKNQGYINGLSYDKNALASGTEGQLRWAADMVRVGLAGSVRNFSFTTQTGETKTLQQIDYNGQPAGYVSAPSEVVNYVENHDNPTLFDVNTLKLPLATSAEDRARVQMLGAAVVAFSQGVAYYHAGVDTLRSKSFDRNSYNSGDWFNRLDWSYSSNNFGVGLPPAGDNQPSWATMKPYLANTALQPASSQITFARDAFRDLLRIRASTPLLRLPSSTEIEQRLSFPNTGTAQDPTVLVGRINGVGYSGAVFKELLYFINVAPQAKTLTLPELAGKAYVLHPVHSAPNAADKRPLSASYSAASGEFTIPPRTAMAYVLN